MGDNGGRLVILHAAWSVHDNGGSLVSAKWVGCSVDYNGGRLVN